MKKKAEYKQNKTKLSACNTVYPRRNGVDPPGVDWDGVNILEYTEHFSAYTDLGNQGATNAG